MFASGKTERRATESGCNSNELLPKSARTTGEVPCYTKRNAGITVSRSADIPGVVASHLPQSPGAILMMWGGGRIHIGKTAAICPRAQALNYRGTIIQVLCDLGRCQ
jgi:hypothetical protein